MMPNREYKHVLDDMLEAIEGIQQALMGKSREDYADNWLLRSGVQRGIEVISEASKAIPDGAESPAAGNFMGEGQSDR